MIAPVLFAVMAGVLVGVSRQVNGRLSLSTSPLVSSLWNHMVGLAALSAWGLAVGGLFPPGATDTPWHAWLGGPIGVIFVASGSWLVARIGALNTALMVIGGQMVSGVAFDLIAGASGVQLISLAGVTLILAGVVLTLRRRPADTDG